MERKEGNRNMGGRYEILLKNKLKGNSKLCRHL